MAKECTLEICDEVNIKFHGLDVGTRRALSNSVKFFIPHAKHTPAYKLGRWDGYERFCTIGAASYFNILDVLLPIVQKDGYYINIDDKRLSYDFTFDEVDKNTFSHVKWPKGHQCEGQDIVLRDHQIEIINTYLTNTQSIQEIPTGSGKTLITAALSFMVQKYGRSILIVPSKDLVTQTEADYINMGLDVGVFYGERKDANHQHVICTWQSIESLDKKSKNYDPEFNLDDLMRDVVCVMVDEAHNSKAAVLSKHLTGTFKNVPIRWGLTGTIPLEPHASTHLICGIGRLVNSLTAKDLQEKGVLSNLHIKIVQVNDYKNVFDSYQSELKYLVTDKKRVAFLASIINDITASGNTLILVDRVATGHMLSELIPNSVFLDGTVKSTDRKSEYNKMKTLDDHNIIATYGICSTGIDVPRIFNLVLIEAGKSFIKVVQSIGRGLRVAKDKDFVNVYDVTSTAKYAKRHLATRKKYYEKCSYPSTTFKVDMPTDL